MAHDLIEQWNRAVAGDQGVRAEWRLSEGGVWAWENNGVRVNDDGSEWCAYEWPACNSVKLKSLSNFVIEVTVSGNAEAAGLSFGPFKDFLARLYTGTGSHHLQIEADAESGCWAFRVDGQLMNRCWWDSAIKSVEDIINGVLTLKAKKAEEVVFQGLTFHTYQSSCQLSVIITCYRFLQRLRVSLRNWCHQNLPTGAYELLIVNPQSPDGTHEHLAAVARSYPHVRVREIPVGMEMLKNKGAMINRAVSVSRGEWLWLTDADCLFAPDCAAEALNRIKGRTKSLFYGQRRHLTSIETDALIAGRTDALQQFAELADRATLRHQDNSPWGYTQILHRSTMERIRYSERHNHFAHTDGFFVDECKRYGVLPQQLEGLICLHLDHPFAWYGTDLYL